MIFTKLYPIARRVSLFPYKKIRFKQLYLAFLGSILLHSPLVFLYKYSASKNQALLEEEKIAIYNYPPHEQIVNQQAFNKIKSRTDTPYLSQADKAVEKETQAMLKGLFYQAEVQNTSPTKNSSLESQKIKKSSPPASSSSMLLSRDLSSATHSKPLNKVSEPLQANILEGGGLFQEIKRQDMSRTMDFLPLVEQGSHTLLNTREFMYYSYFARMKERLYWDWIQFFKTELNPATFRFTPVGSQRLFSTSVYVYLYPDGEVQSIQVTKSSGSEDIDSAALHAFLAAAPFPNPPEGLIEKDGYIHIKQGFHLYVSPSSFDDLFSKQN